MHKEKNNIDTTQHSDQEWADLLSPSRRKLLVNSSIGAAVASAGFSASALAAAPLPPPIVRSPDTTPDGRLIEMQSAEYLATPHKA